MLLASQILSTFLGAFFLIAGWLKATGNAHMVKEFQRFNYPQWLRVLAGLVELVAAPFMLTAFCWPGLAALGALIVCPVMVGATYTNFAKRPASFGWGTLVLLLICMALVYLQREWLLLLPAYLTNTGLSALLS
jgi:hypothetical protein